MAARDSSEKRNGRHAILDLAPLELDCLRALWPMGEGTVRDIREALRARTPRAYTTIMTILDRMARKGIVSRRKAGRAWIYSPNISAANARARAIERLVEHFFAGSPEALAMQLAGKAEAPAAAVSRVEEANAEPRRAVRRELAAKEPAPAQALRMDDVLL
jgi:BlaI family penicillinase repressor